MLELTFLRMQELMLSHCGNWKPEDLSASATLIWKIWVCKCYESLVPMSWHASDSKLENGKTNTFVPGRISPFSPNGMYWWRFAWSVSSLRSRCFFYMFNDSFPTKTGVNEKSISMWLKRLKCCGFFVIISVYQYIGMTCSPFLKACVKHNKTAAKRYFRMEPQSMLFHANLI